MVDLDVRTAVPIAACVALALLVGAAGAARAQTPLPPRDPGRSVYDPAGVIRPEHEARMEAMHAELFRKTGVAIVVVAVPALEGETIGDLAVRVGQTWGAGRAGEDRGIAVALARDDREVFIATGYGVEGYLPDGRVGAILDQYALPHLRQGDFSTGLFQTSAALVTASAEEFGVEITGTDVPRVQVPGGEPSPRQRLLRWLGILVLGVVFLYLLIRHPRLLVLLLLFGHGRRDGGFGGGGFGGFGGFGGGGFGGGGAGRRF